MNVTLERTRYRALRSAGFLYFLMGITAPVGLIYVPGRIMVSGDAAATADNIRNYGGLLNLAIGSELFHQAIAVFLVMALYRLFKPVNENQAKLLVILGALVSVPVMFLNLLNEIAARILTGGAGYLTAFPKTQLDALAYLFLKLHGYGIDIASVFWGLWLFPFGILVIQSEFIPKIIGMLLFVAGSGYLIAATATLVLPGTIDSAASFALILEMGELPVMIWLLIMAIRPWNLKIE